MSGMRPKSPTGPLTITGQACVRITDISAVETLYLMLPKCKVTRIWAVLSGAIITANPTITASKNAQAITNGVITIPYSGSAAGDIAFCQPTVYNEFNGINEYLKLVGGAQSGNVVPVLVVVEYELQDINMPTANPTGPPTIIGTAMARMVDLDTGEDLYLFLPKCRIIKIFSVLGGATLTIADAVITASKGVQAITGGVITIATAGAAAGDIDSCTPTLYNYFNGTTDYLKLSGNGGPTAGSPALFTVIYELL